LIDGKNLFYDWYDRLNAHSFIQFVMKFTDSLPKDRRYVFIMDNASAHKAKVAIESLSSLGERFIIEFLPPYSPKFNAIETCWKTTRHEVTNSNLFQNIDDLKNGIEEFLDNHIFSLNPSNYLVR